MEDNDKEAARKPRDRTEKGLEEERHKRDDLPFICSYNEIIKCVLISGCLKSARQIVIFGVYYFSDRRGYLSLREVRFAHH